MPLFLCDVQTCKVTGERKIANRQRNLCNTLGKLLYVHLLYVDVRFGLFVVHEQCWPTWVQEDHEQMLYQPLGDEARTLRAMLTVGLSDVDEFNGRLRRCALR